MCRSGNETLEHFLINCPSLESVRRPIIDCIYTILGDNDALNCIQKPLGLMKLVIDMSMVLPSYLCDDTCGCDIEFQCRRLIYNLHAMRNRLYANMR